MPAASLLSNLVLGPVWLLLEFFFSSFFQLGSAALSLVLLGPAVSLVFLPLRAAAASFGARAAGRPGGRKPSRLPLRTAEILVPLLPDLGLFLAARRFTDGLEALSGASLGPVRDLSLPDGLLGGQLSLLPFLAAAAGLLPVLFSPRRPGSGRTLPRLLPRAVPVPALLFAGLTVGAPSGFALFWILFLLSGFLLRRALSPVFRRLRALLSRPGSGKRPAPDAAGRRSPAPVSRPGFFGKAAAVLRTYLRGRPAPGFFFLCAALLSVLTGLTIPSSVLAASPQEFVEYLSDLHPLWNLANSFLLAAGFFMLWPGLLYLLSPAALKKALEAAAWAASACFLVTFLFCRNGLGTVSPSLVYDVTPVYGKIEGIIQLTVLLVLSAGAVWLLVREKGLTRGIALALAVVLTGLSAWNMAGIRRETEEVYRVQERNYSGEKVIPLSRGGNNVVVLMLDRAISSYLPCILYERPDLREVFSGFVYYPNALSFAMHTNLGAPPLFGGYEYTPLAVEERKDELLRDKYNEALLLMPTLFSRQGYRVSVFDVPYPGSYTDAGDYTIFDSLPRTNARILRAAEDSAVRDRTAENARLRNFFCYSLAMAGPTLLFNRVYDLGNYHRLAREQNLYSPGSGSPRDEGRYVSSEFLAEYEVLRSLGAMTKVSDGEGDTFLLLVNNTTHTPVLLPEPEYAPVREPDNAAYDAAHADRFLAGPLPLRFTTDRQMAHYQVDMAALLRVGEWLEQLKREGVYDRTRIIIAADHGYDFQQIPGSSLPADGNLPHQTADGKTVFEENIMGYNPLLMVKDFGAVGPVRTDASFMTNADVPGLALSGLVENPVNPFTGQPVSSDAKNGPLYVSTYHGRGVGRDRGNTYGLSTWLIVRGGGDTLFDPSRWTFRADP